MTPTVAYTLAVILTVFLMVLMYWLYSSTKQLHARQQRTIKCTLQEFVSLPIAEAKKLIWALIVNLLIPKYVMHNDSDPYDPNNANRRYTACMAREEIPEMLHSLERKSNINQRLL